MMEGTDDVTRAILGPVTASPPRVALTPLQRLSLRHQQALSVVLCADAEASSSATRKFDAVEFGVKTVYDDVEVALRAHPQARRGRQILGLGEFGELRELCFEGVAS